MNILMGWYDNISLSTPVLRLFMPTYLTPEYIQMIEDKLNNRPRKSLN